MFRCIDPSFRNLFSSRHTRVSDTIHLADTSLILQLYSNERVPSNDVSKEKKKGKEEKGVEGRNKEG